MVGFRWVFTVKVGPDGQVDVFDWGYTPIFGLDYGDTFSPVEKLSSPFSLDGGHALVASLSIGY